MQFLVFPGAHKTASTFSQGILQNNRSVLEERGYYFIDRDEFYSSDLCQHLRCLSHGLKADISIEQARTSLQQLSKGNLTRSIILSIENLLGEFDSTPYRGATNVLKRIQRLIPDHEMRVTFCCRRQDTFLESVFLQMIHKGKLLGFSDFWAKYGEPGIDWCGLADQMREAVGPERLRVIPFETILDNEPADYLKLLFADVPSTVIDGFDFSTTGVSNPSLTATGLNVALASFGYLSVAERRQLSKALKSIVGGKQHGKPQLVSEAARDELLSRMRPSNERLFEEHVAEPQRELASYYLNE